MALEGFLLTRQWTESGPGQDLIFWVSTQSGPLKIVIEAQESVFFVPESRLAECLECLRPALDFRHAEVRLKDFKDEAATAFYFKSQKLLNLARLQLENKGIHPLEADIRPTDRYLMERFITGPVVIEGHLDEQNVAKTKRDDAGKAARDSLSPTRGFPLYRNPQLKPGNYHPDLKVMSLDIETSYIDNTLYSIGLMTHALEKVFMLGTEPSSTDFLEFHASEAEVIQAFLESVCDLDPDIIIGWSVVNFDLSFLQRKCDELGIVFELGRNRESVRWRNVNRTPSGSDRHFALVPGRAVLDGIEILRSATYSFESFSLETVSRQLLGRGKLIEQVDGRADEINDLFAKDKKQLAAYNLEDCRLVLEIFDKADLINFALERTSLTGLDLDRAGGSVAAFDYLYLPRLHRHGRVAPVVEEENRGSSPGGYVLDSIAGLYDHVIVLDFKSLYPSIIRTFNVDPLAMIAGPADQERIPGFKGADFSRTEFILPAIIEELWTARDQAKRSANNALSQAIKIIMNSFYGVLGTPGCRFYDARLVSSITLRGHEILQKTRDLIQEYGYEVIYGDTDSVFVLLKEVSTKSDADLIGSELTDFLNRWWTDHLAGTYSITSCLEVEYESYFEKFLMPTVRGSAKGSKKRYAGMTRAKDGEPLLVFKGLETVRSDWTPLARSFQKQLYHLIFTGRPVEKYILETVNRVTAGEIDAELVLRRRLRRPLTAYQKNISPHVRAAQIIDKERTLRGLPLLYQRGGWVEYFMTVNGPEPKEYMNSAIDYQFYIDKQLMPVADAILSFQHQSFAQIIDRQMNLF